MQPTLNHNQLLTELDKELIKYLRIVVNLNKKRNVLIRGFLYGIATAVGATIGFTIVLLVLSQVVTNLKSIPLVDNFLRETKLDVLIEKQLNELEREEVNPDSEDSEDSAADDAPIYSTYSNTKFNISFEYPLYFNKINENSISEDESLITFSGSGALKELRVYINPSDLTITGDHKEVTSSGNTTIDIYENEIRLNQDLFERAGFVAEYTVNDNKIIFVGFAEDESPKLAREIFLSVVGSVE